MSKRDETPPDDGMNAAFRTTHWSQILAAQSQDEPQRTAALEGILATYWKPVYCYLRCKGHAHERAKDLTQGFFIDVVLGRRLVQQADRARGRFRTFLLRALDRYLASVHRAEKAKHRMPEGGLLNLECVDSLDVPQPIHYTTPVEVFDYAWASALLDEVVTRVAHECQETGKAIHWQIFHARILQPIMDGSEPPSLASVCATYDIPNKAKAFNMIITVKRRFQAALRRRVRQFVDSDAEVDLEIHHLMNIFRRAGARK